MYAIDFASKARKVMGKWKKSDPVSFRKLGTVLDSIMDDPRHGIGHPEPLVGGGGVTWSRHITGKDRIIYDIYDDEVKVLVLELEGHYDDK